MYVSCIKQFWTTVVVKKVNDVIRLQALVDKKKVVVTKAMIRAALCLDDAEGVECLPNKEIFAELARMGYEKPSTKLTFYKAFFSSHLVRNVDNPSKFYMYPYFLQLIIKKQVGDLSTHTTKYTSPALIQKVFSNIRRVGKGFSGVDTPLFKEMLIAQVIEEGDADENVENVNAGDAVEGDVGAANDEVQPQSPQPQQQPQPTQDAGIPMNLLQEVMNTCTALSRRVEHLELDKIAQALEITKLKRRVKKLERRNKVKGRMIAEMDQDADVVLEDDKEVADEVKDVQDDIDETQVPAATLTAAPRRMTKGVVIRDPEESTTTTSTIIHTEAKSKDKGKVKEDPAVKRYQALKRKPQTEAQARKNMMVYLKNVAGFKMDYFKGMSYDDIRPIFERYFDSNVAILQKTKEQIEEEESRALKRINETPAEKARKKLDEEVEELKRHLQIVSNEDDDVYTEATPLARKVPVVDYEIIEQNNKPYYKIIRADGTHQLYISFLSLLRNFDREDLEALWVLVKK
nr:hypothetical protein [Tanacetum cinerariifolium]